MQQIMDIMEQLAPPLLNAELVERLMEKWKVLIVEGHRETREALKWMFQQADYTVMTAENTAVAWGALGSFEPDLILTDLMMPLIAGEEFIKVLKRQPRFAAIPIVVLSEYSDIFEENAKAAGATAVLRKPRDIWAVIETVNQLLGESAE